MADKYESYEPGMSDPAERAASVTPSDTDDLANFTKALYVGGTGDLRVETVGGDDVTFSSVAVGWFPVRCKRVFSTSTTATNIIAVW